MARSHFLMEARARLAVKKTPALRVAAGFLLLMLGHGAVAENGAIAHSRLPRMEVVVGVGRTAWAKRVFILRGGGAGGGESGGEGADLFIHTGLSKTPGRQGYVGEGFGEAVGRGRGISGGGKSKNEVDRSKSPHEVCPSPEKIYRRTRIRRPNFS